MLDFLAFLVPKVHWGLKNMWKNFWEFAKKIGDLRRNFVRPTLSNLLLSAQACFNFATRWRSLILQSCNPLLISTWTKVFKVFIRKIYVLKQSVCV